MVTRRKDPKLFDYKMKNPKNMVTMAIYLIENGMSCRDVARQLIQIYNKRISNVTIARWARKNGIIFKGRSRLKPCRYCGSHTLHKQNCIIYIENKKLFQMEPKGYQSRLF